MSRNAKPIDTLLKMKLIKPDIEFRGADKYAYEEFLAEQAEASLIDVLKEQVEEKPKKKSTKKTKKVKQTIPEEIVETGSIEVEEPVYETKDDRTEEAV